MLLSASHAQDTASAGALGAGPGLKPSLAMGEARQERGWGETLGNEFSPGVSQSLRKPRACLVHLPGLIHEDVLIKEIRIFFLLVSCQSPSTRRQTTPAEKTKVPLLSLILVRNEATTVGSPVLVGANASGSLRTPLLN